LVQATISKERRNCKGLTKAGGSDKQGNIKLLDLMRITYCDFGGNTAVRYSINDFGVGFPAKVSFRVNNMKGALKGLGAMQLQSSLK